MLWLILIEFLLLYYKYEWFEFDFDYKIEFMWNLLASFTLSLIIYLILLVILLNIEFKIIFPIVEKYKITMFFKDFFVKYLNLIENFIEIKIKYYLIREFSINYIIIYLFLVLISTLI